MNYLSTAAMAFVFSLAIGLTTGSACAQNNETTSSIAASDSTTGAAGKKRDKKAAGAKKDKKKAGEKAGVKMANNANCPVSGQPVGSMQPGSHIIYKGYNVGLCCDGCKGGFNDTHLNKALGR